MTRAALVCLLRWLRLQRHQPTATREHLEAAVENDDPSEVRRLVGNMEFTPEQRRHVEGLLDAWEEGRG